MAKKPKPKIVSREEVLKQLADLVKLVQVSPKFKQKKKRLGKEFHEGKIPDEMQDLLDYHRVILKYMLFDIEAYQREIRYLRKLLKDNGIEL